MSTETNESVKVAAPSPAPAPPLQTNITAKFGTAPVFLTAISTILGAIMFLRFGYAVSQVGFLGTVGIVLIGHVVTIATAMAIAEIATNQKVEGGGEYYIISRSFGINIGASIGVALYLSQAISVAFYIIAFAQAFEPVFAYIIQEFGFTPESRMVSIPALALLALLMLTKGADVGVKALYVVVATLFVSLVLFFVGQTDFSETATFSYVMENNTAANPDTFFYVFAICFPAFTGMTAGVGLSGDLKDPKKSIPMGTLAATISGMVIYVFIAYKLAYAASPEDLAADQLVMGRIAAWGPIIPIGLAAATISSALGSIMVAPRTLQALGKDGIFPNSNLNDWFAKGTAKNNEPRNATYLTIAIAFVFVLMGDVNAVAEVISMFFMVTYGSICLISFMEHFAADPAYRPSFRSRWYFSLLGAVMCIWLMFKMNPIYAVISLILMILIYLVISNYRKEGRGIAGIFQGVIFQLSRRLAVFLQKSVGEENETNWRPSMICISSHTFDRYYGFELLRWISRKYGFGTYIHLLEGYVSKSAHEEALKCRKRLIDMAHASKSNVYLNTIISPSYTSSIAQAVQLPGVSGKENNMVLFEYLRENEGELTNIIENMALVRAMGFDICVLSGHHRGFGFRKEIDIWITTGDYANANLMILMAYIILGHPDWAGGEIKIFVTHLESELEKERAKLLDLIHSGRLPISANNIEMIPIQSDTDHKTTVSEKSRFADLVIIGFLPEAVKHNKEEEFSGYDLLGNILFVNSSEEKVIK
ncbi:MAG: amino acid permease [Bacteroidota bacterium]